MHTRTCVICGQEFQARFPSVKVCTPCKNRSCVVCGKPFLHEQDPVNQKCCSRKCANKFKRDPENIKIWTAQRDKTVIERYGVTNVSKLEESRKRISFSKTDREAYDAIKEEERKQREIELAAPKYKKCSICGKFFQSFDNKTVCNNKHYRKCKVCGKDFEISHVSDKRQTCSRECWSELRKLNLLEEEHTCKYCGKKFHSMGSRVSYCAGPHYATCQVCGKRFKIFLREGMSPDYLPKTCSDSCKEIQRQRTCLDKYGFAFAAQTPEAREQAREKSLENQEQREATCLARYGYKNVGQVPEFKKKISKTIASEENQEKMKATMRERYGVDHVMQSTEFARKHSASQFKHQTCDGTRVDSRWEAIVYDFLKRNNIDFEYNTVSIPYEYEGKSHVTHIDFKVGDLLLEVKGSHLLQGTYEDSGLIVPIKVKLDLYKKHHVIVITDSTCADLFGKPNSAVSNGLKYLDKCPEPLIGIDFELFNYPEFPYRDDRPPCFYNVRVDGERSSCEAFFDESVRWKMIENRIRYTGGFIDAKQVLTAMNVTRTCKQPSWFSKSLARRIIQEYCTSSTIVDCFAGWGMRHDAARELGKNYVGIDFNPELVDWHQWKGRSIEFGDANEFQYNEECSVFICPPYSDPATGRCFEDYNFDGFNESAKALSQCDWLKIVMKNVPNAHEYIMVCKIVDDEFKPCIKETLENRSHFGTNNEYVVVVENSEIQR